MGGAFCRAERSFLPAVASEGSDVDRVRECARVRMRVRVRVRACAGGWVDGLRVTT